MLVLVKTQKTTYLIKKMTIKQKNDCVLEPYIEPSRKKDTFFLFFGKTLLNK